MSLRLSNDLTLEDINLGTVRNKKKHTRKQTPKLHLQPPKKATWCLDCDKRGFRSEQAARESITRQVDRWGKRLNGGFATHPYVCPHGWWHFGRNFQTVKRFQQLRPPTKAA